MSFSSQNISIHGKEAKGALLPFIYTDGQNFQQLRYTANHHPWACHQPGKVEIRTSPIQIYWFSCRFVWQRTGADCSGSWWPLFFPNTKSTYASIWPPSAVSAGKRKIPTKHGHGCNQSHDSRNTLLRAKTRLPFQSAEKAQKRNREHSFAKSLKGASSTWTKNFIRALQKNFSFVFATSGIIFWQKRKNIKKHLFHFCELFQTLSKLKTQLFQRVGFRTFTLNSWYLKGDSTKFRCHAERVVKREIRANFNSFHSRHQWIGIWLKTRPKTMSSWPLSQVCSVSCDGAREPCLAKTATQAQWQWPELTAAQAGAEGNQKLESRAQNLFLQFFHAAYSIFLLAQRLLCE